MIPISIEKPYEHRRITPKISYIFRNQRPSHHPSLHHPSSHHPITTSSHHPTPNFQHAKNLRKSAKRICENLRETHHHITSFAFISGFSSTKFSGVRLGIKRSERSNISTKNALYNNIIIGFCSESTEYKLKG